MLILFVMLVGRKVLYISSYSTELTAHFFHGTLAEFCEMGIFLIFVKALYDPVILAHPYVRLCCKVDKFYAILLLLIGTELRVTLQ